MTIKILTFAMLSALFLNSCKDTPKQDTDMGATENVDNTNDEIVTTTSTSKDGKELDITFNNTKGTATLNFNGETIEMTQQRAASGIWYKNDQYELRGKGNDLELRKDDKVVFTHEDDIVTTSLKNERGQTLNLTFNNSIGQVKAYLDGGDQIEMEQQRAGSGIWYKNEQYELRGKGNDLELTKDGNVIFTHKDAIIKTTLKNKEGQTLDLTVNNTTNTAKVYLDGGEQIDLVGENPASGIWYKNDHYELRGKGEKIE